GQGVPGEPAAESQPAYVLGGRLKEFMERWLDAPSDPELPIYVPKFGPMSEGTKLEAEVTETPAPEPAAPDSKAEQKPEASTAPVDAPQTLRAGPLDDNERATITRLAADGVARPVIAAQLGRRVQSVSLYLSSLEQAKSKIEAQPREAQKAPPPAPAKVPAKAAAPAKTARFDEHKAELDHLDREERAAAKISNSAPAPVKVPAKAAAPIPKPPAPPAPKITVTAPVSAAVTAEKQAEPVWHAPIDRHLTTLGYSGGWSAGLDLDLVEGLSKGIKLGMLATDLGLDTSALKSRFTALTACVRDDFGMMTIEQQKRLLTVLRSRAPAKGSAA
ncbi:MAG: hypothetical protein V7668_20250, partial [Cereibacter changlensis]